MTAYDRLRVRTPLVVGGRSAGARSAARLARRMGAVGVLALSFPLHPAGRPEKTRVDELRAPGCRRWWCRASATTWVDPRSSPTTCPGSTSSWSPTPTTGCAVRKSAPISQEEAYGLVVEATLEWMVREATPRR